MSVTNSMNGKLLKIFKYKHIKEVNNSLNYQLLALHRKEIFVCGKHIKRATRMSVT
jgi:hypothetical protein